MPFEAPVATLVMLSTLPVAPAAELVRFSNVPVVIDDVTSVIAVCVLSEPHCHVWAKFVLLIVLTAVADVRAESERTAVPEQPTQLDTVSTPFTLTLPLK